MLDPKVMDVLVCLAASGGKVVSRESLMDDVWKGTVVSDFALSRCIYQLRKNLGEAARTGESPIMTLPKRGYRLTWPVDEPDAGQPSASGKSRPAWIAAALLTLVVAGVVGWLARDAAPPAVSHPVVAVLPFNDLTPDQSLGYFGDGIAQGVLDELGHIVEIDVIARTSSFHFKGSDVLTGDIAAELGADYLVEGSVARENDTVHVSAALVDSRNGQQAWSGTFNGMIGQPFTAQQDIAGDIADHLELSLGNPREHGGTTSLEALHAYLRAFEADGQEAARMLLDEALAHDPDFAQAIAHKANLRYLRVWQGIEPPQQAWDELRPQLDHALSVSEKLPLAYTLIGGFQIMLGDHEAAEGALQRALEINPSHDYALVHLSRLREHQGRWDEAVAIAERNTQLNPLNSFRHLQLANRRWTAGNYEGGKASFERAFELNPTSYAAWHNYALRLSNKEGPLEGFRLVARLQDNSEFRALFTGATPAMEPYGISLFTLWFGFIGDQERQWDMLQLQSVEGDSAELHRELGWWFLREGDVENARREAWVAIEGMPRNDIANFLMAEIALRSKSDLDEVLAHYHEYWPGLNDMPPRTETVPGLVVVSAALVQGELGNDAHSQSLLESIAAEEDSGGWAFAIALTHRGETDAALDTLEKHTAEGNYIWYRPGSPWWARLAEEPRFQAMVEAEEAKNAVIRAEVEAMLESGELILPGQLGT